ncbi:winged helix-turn-helix transcriptional regulator [Methanocaldococcus sp.]|uniref:PadR family transcriptional regulator n=1 Tax=Methanocaldococcus sp. TaxID=2152917 RepID=UPI00260859EB|nr:winged helix-turn-helix transcriptional regulator [Methanocaldococcus sp.]MCQ6254738.1 winged helix-turn-helix transcriptional regulator [Methanocaldococcus sp.]
MLNEIKLLKILSKKNNYLVLKTLFKNNALYFRELKKELKMDGKTIYRALEELVNAGLVKKEIEEPEKRTSRVYYSLTEFGKKVVKIYDYIEQLEKELEDKNAIIINGNVGDNNIIANKIQNSKIYFKK